MRCTGVFDITQSDPPTRTFGGNGSARPMMWRDAARGSHRHRPTGRPARPPLRRLRSSARGLPGTGDAEWRVRATLEPLAPRVGPGRRVAPDSDVFTGAR